MIELIDTQSQEAVIKVVGVGGCGGNAVDHMIAQGVQGVEFVVANTDAQALTMSKADRLIQLGAHVTEGLGAGSQPEVGRAAAEECIDEIVDHLEGYAEAIGAPVRTGVEVESVTRGDDGFAVQTSNGDLRTRAVIMATGAYPRPYRPPVATAPTGAELDQYVDTIRRLTYEAATHVRNRAAQLAPALDYRLKVRCDENGVLDVGVAGHAQHPAEERVGLLHLELPEAALLPAVLHQRAVRCPGGDEVDVGLGPPNKPWRLTILRNRLLDGDQADFHQHARAHDVVVLPHDLGQAAPVAPCRHGQQPGGQERCRDTWWR